MQEYLVVSSPGELADVQHRVTRKAVAAGARTLRARLLLGAGVSFATIVLLDVVIGLAFCRDGTFWRWKLPPYGLLFNESQREWLQADSWSYYDFDRDLGWTIKPHGIFREGLYRANAQGIRADREYAIDPDPGMTRIAAFGDSFMHGDDVANDETAMALLEKLSGDLDILNFGVPGYGTDQAFLRYLHDGARFRPDVVLIGLMPENIQRNVSVLRTTYFHATGLPLAKPRFHLGADESLGLSPCPVTSRSELRESLDSGSLLSTLRATDYWVQRVPLAYQDSPWFTSSLARIGCAVWENGGRDYQAHYRQTDGEPFSVTVALLAEFARTALDGGARQAVVVILPDKATLRLVSSGGDRYWHTLVARLREQRIDVWDPTDDLLAASASSDVDRLFNGSHYSPMGNSIVAGSIFLNVLAD